MIKGLHHVSIKAYRNSYDKIVEFYNKILGFDILLSDDRCIMFKCNDFIVEVFFNATKDYEKGVISHFALNVSDIDSLIEKLDINGYKIFLGPKDVSLGNSYKLNAKVAFLNGPVNEEIELFEVL